MGSFAWEIETFGTKDKQLKISRGVINWLGVHSPIQNLPQKITFCLFSRAWHEIKNRYWAFEKASRKQVFLWFAFCQWNFQIRSQAGSDLCPRPFLHLVLDQPKPVSITCRSHGVSMNLRCDTAVYGENETCDKMLDNNNFLHWGARVVIFQLAPLRQILELDLRLRLI